MRGMVLGLLVLLVAGPVAMAVDYQKIDRKLKREPVYQSSSPRYALLLFGREAPLRVWAVLDGKTFYLDREGNGDLTSKDKRYESLKDCKDVTLTSPDGKTKYIITGAVLFEDTKPVPRTSLMFAVKVQGPASFEQYCDVEVGDRPAKAKLAHFDGPLTAQPKTISWKVPASLALKLGDTPADLPMVIGTLDERAGCWTVVRTHGAGDRSAFAEGVFPQVEVTWPAAQSGASSIRERYTLKVFC